MKKTLGCSGFLLLALMGGMMSSPASARDLGDVEGCRVVHLGGRAEQSCKVSIYAVIANPRRYDGIRIGVTGYVRRSSDYHVLYPTKEAFLYGGGDGGIQFDFDTSRVDIFKGGEESQGGVRIFGIFSAGGTYPGSVGWLGDVVLWRVAPWGQMPLMPDD